jgi:hypothetical protein
MPTEVGIHDVAVRGKGKSCMPTCVGMTEMVPSMRHSSRRLVSRAEN